MARPGGRLAFVDDVWGPGRPRSSDRVAGGPDHAHVRRLDQDEFTIVKRFFRPDELVAAFAHAGMEAAVETTSEHFLYGTATTVPRNSGAVKGRANGSSA